MARVIDLNADLGEGIGADEQLLPVITSANVACGVHAGDPTVMAHIIRLAKARGVRIGAHPSFPDREGFGRRAMALPHAQVTAVVADQIHTLAGVAATAGTRLQHVKAHGALYNLAANDAALAATIGDAVRGVDPALIVVALAGSAMVEVLERMGLRVAREAFIDRGYTPAGTLVPREQPGALITNVRAAAERAIQLARDGRVVAVDGTEVEVHADTLCIHGDTPNASDLAMIARHALEDAGITVAAMETFL